MPPTPDLGSAGQPDWRRALLILAAVSLLLLTYRLDGIPFRGLYDDVNRSLTARNMIESGDWLVPTYINKPLYTKPPLMYWTAAGIGVLTGRHDELPGNLTSVLGMFMVVLATFWAGRNLFGTRTGLWAGLLLITMHLFLGMGRMALLDTVMMGGFALTFGALVHIGFSGTSRPTLWWLVMALGLAISFLTKGPVILPVVLLIWLPLLRLKPALRPSWRQFLLGLALITLLILPWPLVLMWKAPAAIEVWRNELFGRFGDGHQFHAWTQKPAWFYLPDLVNTLPWTLLLPGAVMAAFRGRQDPRFRLLLWWAVGGFIFFSLASATKRSYYLLPLYPAFALLIAAGWGRLVKRTGEQDGQRWRTRLMPMLTLALVGLVGFVFVLLPFKFPHVPRTAFVICGLAIVTLSTGAILVARRNRWDTALGLTLAAAVFIHLAYYGHFMPVANTYFSGKPFYAEVSRMVDGQDIVLLEVHSVLSVFYLEGIPTRYANRARFPGIMATEAHNLVIASPAIAAEFPELELVFQREFTEPLGQTRALGLYRFRP